jgi:hypothetical protein
MNTDEHFLIGKSHEVCEDYALSYKDKERAILVLSDGCSSSDDTDVGARILCHNAMRTLRQTGYNITSYGDLKEEVIDLSIQTIDSMGLDITCLNATLLTVYNSTDSDFIDVYIYGDGVLITKYIGDDNIYIQQAEFTTNAPYYPIYAFDKAIADDISMHKEYKRVYGQENSLSWSQFGLDDPLQPFDYPTYCIIHKKNLEWLAIASDGLTSFINEDHTSENVGERIDLTTIVKDLLDFKGIKGKFVKRRLKRYLKDMNKKQIRNFDDVSLAVMHMD